MPTITQITEDIKATKDRLAILQQIEADMQSAINFANSQRPSGIPPSWKPRFEGVPPNVRIFAWFDPNKYGDGQSI